MSRLSRLPAKDLERLSAYLDGDLSPRQASALEARLGRDENLRACLQELRQVVLAVRQLPEVRPPRSFTLRSEAVGGRASVAFPVLRFATVVASALFVLTTVLRAAPVRGFGFAAQAPLPAVSAAEGSAQDSLSQEAAAEPGPGEMLSTPAPGAGMRASATAEAAPEAMALAPTSPADAAPTPTECPDCPPSLAAVPEASAGEAELDQALRSVEVPRPVGPGLAPLQWALGLLTVGLLVLTWRARRR